MQKISKMKVTMKKNTIIFFVLFPFLPFFLYSSLPSIEHFSTTNNLQELRPTILAKYCLSKKDICPIAEETENDWIEEEPTLHLKSLLFDTITALKSDTSNTDALEKLRESWTIIGNLSCETFDFNNVLKDNFKSIKFSIDFKKVYICLGFNSLQEMTFETAQTRSKEILELYNTLVNNNLECADKKNAVILLKEKATALYASNLINRQEWDQQTTPQSIDTSVLSPEILSQFKESISPLLSLVRQTGYLTREPIHFHLIKSFFQSEEKLLETQHLYQSSIKDFQLINPTQFFTEINDAICLKKRNEYFDKNEALVETLSQIHNNLLSEKQPDTIFITAITFLTSWMSYFQ